MPPEWTFPNPEKKLELYLQISTSINQSCSGPLTPPHSQDVLRYPIRLHHLLLQKKNHCAGKSVKDLRNTLEMRCLHHELNCSHKLSSAAAAEISNRLTDCEVGHKVVCSRWISRGQVVMGLEYLFGQIEFTYCLLQTKSYSKGTYYFVYGALLRSWAKHMRC